MWLSMDDKYKGSNDATHYPTEHMHTTHRDITKMKHKTNKLNACGI